MITEVEGYNIRALIQQQQGSWTVGEEAVNKTNIWKMSQARLSFAIRFMHDTLPFPSNLCLEYSSEESCQLCSVLEPSLQHIWSSCKTGLGVIQQRLLAEVLGAQRREATKDHPSTA